MPNLWLNEALLTVNAKNISAGPLEAFYQVEQCFGCPLTPLRPVEGEPNTYVLDTKYSVQLELRHNSTAGGSCRLDNLVLNSQAQYRLDVTVGQAPGKLECALKTLDFGECLLCPFAILICFLLALVTLEQAYSKFWRARPTERPDGRKLSSLRSDDDDEGEDEVDGDGDGEADEDGGDVVGVEAANVEEGQLAGRKGGHLAPNGEAAMSRGSVAGSIRTLGSSRKPARLSVEQQTGGATSPKTADINAAVVAAAAAFEQGAPPPPPTSGQRVQCLDVFRGLTLAGMIFVNYGGAGYAIWDHKPWDGLTLADFVFPFFIFSMGAAIAISVKSLVKRRQRPFNAIALKIFKRSLILVLLGICLNSKALDYDRPDGLSKLRLTGVLQRFGVSYLVIAFMYTIELTLSKWTRAQSLSNVPYLSKLIGVLFELLTAINYTAIYVYVTFYFHYDSTGNCPAGYTGPGGQTAGGQYAACTGGAAAWLDKLILGESHLYNDHEVKQMFKTQVAHDPEGILGYTTSIVLTLIGLQCGKILIGKRTTPKMKLLALLRWAAALALSCLLVLFIPINKRLWSLSFVLVTALAAFVLITALYLLIDVYTCKRAFVVRLLASAGKNSIFLYVAHSLVHGLLPWWFPLADPTSHMQLLFRLTWSTLVWLLVAHYMACKGLFIKV